MRLVSLFSIVGKIASMTVSLAMRDIVARRYRLAYLLRRDDLFSVSICRAIMRASDP